MAFWGIEVKPGKAFTIHREKFRGRLRISQAALGIGDSTKKSIVRCNVGIRCPRVICVLLPNLMESCHLELEFEEVDDVSFSVLGPRSVHLTGYYVHQNPPLFPKSDTESYGMDIEHTDGSTNDESNDYNYEDSFINDNDLQSSPPSPVLNNKGTDEDTPRNDKRKKLKKARGKKLKKRHQVIESDTDVSNENDDEDRFLSSESKNKDLENTLSKVEEKIADITDGMGDVVKDNGSCDDESKVKVDDGRSQRESEMKLDDKVTQVTCNDEFEQKVDNRQSERVSQMQLDDDDKVTQVTSDEESNGKVDNCRYERISETQLDGMVTQVTGEKDEIPANLYTLTETAVSGGNISIGKVTQVTGNDKFEEKVGNLISERISETQLDGMVTQVSVEKDEIPANLDTLTETAVNGGNISIGKVTQVTGNDKFEEKVGNVISERISETQLDGMVTQATGEKDEIPANLDTLNEIAVNGGEISIGNHAHDNIVETIICENLPASDGKDPSPDPVKPKKKRKERSVEKKISDIEINKDNNVLKEDKGTEVKAPNNTEIASDCLVELGSQKGQKTKKRKKVCREGTLGDEIVGKSQDIPKYINPEKDTLHADGNVKDLPESGEFKEPPNESIMTTKSELVNTGVLNVTNNQETVLMQSEVQTTDPIPVDKWTLSNGLIIEIISKGPPAGKIAKPGKKVKINYTGKLKESGQTFDSNVGKKPLKFQLGDESLIDGWNAGIDGMHVGELRRVIIPPSMGFGSVGVEEFVPPNSWLVFDFELVGVYK